MLTLAVSEHAEIRGRILHFAAEPALVPVFKGRADEYVTTDIEGEVDVRADIIDLPFENDRWDVIVCSHVLEHVPDDAQAISELRRTLAPDGVAIVMVPRAAGKATDEDPSIRDPRERKRRFGQEDHVRLYGVDLEARLLAGGFDQIQPILPEDFPQALKLAQLKPAGGTGDASFFCRSTRGADRR